MRRRLATLFTAALLGSAVLLPLTAMPAMGADTAVVLAASGPASTEGPDPRPADAEDIEFAPPEYEPNWPWRAGGKGLLAVLRLVHPDSRRFQHQPRDHASGAAVVHHQKNTVCR